MKLRNGAHVDRVLDVNPAATSAIAKHNASTPFMRMPLEVKNQVYKYVFGGNLVHVVQNPHEGGPKFICYLCCASISEEEAQKQFDSETDHPWCAPAIESRHESCHESHKKANVHERQGGLSVSPLRSCRQIYNEAHHIPYSTNSFSSNDPKTLQSFIVSLAQGENGNHLAIRSLFLEIVYGMPHHMASWKKAIATCAKHLTRLQNVSISIEWHTFFLINGWSGYYDLVEDGMRWKKNVISSLLTLKKLPLKTASITINDHQAEREREKWFSAPFRSRWIDAEAEYRWTLIEKKERARYVREVLLQS